MDQLTVDTSLVSVKEKKSLLLIFRITAVVYLAVGAACYFQLRTNVNPDGIAYLTIAKNYANGYWKDAVSAYWSPLISWILAPFCWFVKEPLFVFYVYNVLVGLAGIWAVYRLMAYFRISSWLQVMVLPASAIIILGFAYNTTTPDLTSVVLLLFFMRFWLKGGLLTRPVVTATWMTVLYYVKAYNFYFIAGLICFEIVLHLLNKSMKFPLVLKRVAILFALFFLLTAPWLIALHGKYGNLMLAGTSKFNHGSGPGNLTMLGKGIPGVDKLKNNYEFMLRFVDPPHEHSVFAWEDPVLKSDFKDYAVFASRENFLLQLRVMLTNFRVLTGGYVEIYTIVAIGIIIILINVFIALFNWWRPDVNYWSAFDLDAIKLALFYGLYIGGYSLFFLEERYVWINLILVFISAGILLDHIIIRKVKHPTGRPYIVAKLLLGVVTFGIVFYHFFWAYYIAGDFKNTAAGHTQYSIGKAIKPLPAGEKHMVYWPSRDHQTLFNSWFTAYFAEGRHYNCLPEDIATANALIEKNGISYVFVAEDRLVPETFIISRWHKVHIPKLEMNIYTKP